MRVFPIVLVVSLAANIGLAAVYMSIKSQSETEKRPASSKNIPGQKAAPSAAELLAAAFKARNARALLTQLRALGVSDLAARDFVNEVIWQKYYERRRALQKIRSGTGEKYWQRNSKTYSQFTVAERAELRELANKARNESLDILGIDSSLATERTAMRYSFLPPAKVAQLMDLQRDYGEMNRALSDETARFKLPSDAERQRVLRDEYRKDLVAILTPEELDAYDRRFSPTAMTLRRNFSAFQATEAEYLAVYDMMKMVSEAYSTNKLSTLTPAQLSDRRKTAEDVVGEIKAMLGDERYELYKRSQSADYRRLQDAADRFQLPQETINGVYNLRDTVGAESQRILSDTTLSPAEKKQALQTFAVQIKDSVRSQLGAEIGDAYMAGSMQWLQRLSTGSGVLFMTTGPGIRYVDPAPSRTSRPPLSRPASGTTGSKGKKAAPRN